MRNAQHRETRPEPVTRTERAAQRRQTDRKASHHFCEPDDALELAVLELERLHATARANATTDQLVVAEVWADVRDSVARRLDLVRGLASERRALREQNRHLMSALAWLLDENGNWTQRRDSRNPYWWRDELRQRVDAARRLTDAGRT